MTLTLKKGYADGHKAIEIAEGNIDVVLYHEKRDSFIFYRFSPEQVLGITIPSDVYLVSEKHISPFLAVHNKEYESFMLELIDIALTSNMTERYE
jgi:hypothetical protein